MQEFAQRCQIHVGRAVALRASIFDEKFLDLVLHLLFLLECLGQCHHQFSIFLSFSVLYLFPFKFVIILLEIVLCCGGGGVVLYRV